MSTAQEKTLGIDSQPFWTSYAQSDMSPTAASIAKFGDIPVGLATGTPQIKVPIHTVNSVDLQLPVFLQYHASGVRVDEVAGWVGMGWSLQAGGAVTRTVRGLPDEVAMRGYLDSASKISDFRGGSYSTSVLDGTQETKLIEDIEERRIDPTPDVFVFSFPGGGGKFYLRPQSFDGPSGDVVLESQQNIRVEWSKMNTGHVQRFTLTTEDGTQYEFGGDPSAVETVSRKSGTTPTQLEHPSAWYLRRIRSAQGVDEISLEYTSTSLTVSRPSRPTATVSNNFDCYDTGLQQQVSRYSESRTYTTVTNYPRLQGIYSNKDQVVFNSKVGRDDAFGHYLLESIDIGRFRADGSSVPLKSFALDYFYTRTDQPAPEQRLFLQSVTESAGGVGKPSYKFHYDDPESLPEPFTSNAIDWYGFYTGYESSEMIPDKVKVSYLGDAATAGTLVGIEYPTGGSSEIEYEPHEYGWIGEQKWGAGEGAWVKQTVSAHAGDVLTDECDGGCSKEISFTIPENQVISVTAQVVCDAYNTFGKCQAGAVIYPGKFGTQEIEGESFVAVSESDDHIKKKTVQQQFEVGAGDYTIRVEADAYIEAHGLLTFYGPESTPSESGTYAKKYTPRTGGIRVKRITSDPNIPGLNPIIKQFGYFPKDDRQASSGVMVRRPRHQLTQTMDHIVLADGVRQADTDLSSTCRVTFSSSSPLISPGSTGGSHIAYHNVVVSTPGGGETHHSFRTARDGNERKTFGDPPVGGARPLHYQTRDWARGQPIGQTSYRFHNGSRQRIASQETTYETKFLDRLPRIEIRGFSIPEEQAKGYVIDSWDVQAGWVYPTSNVQVTVDPITEDSLVVTESIHHVDDRSDPLYGQVQSMETRTSNGQMRRQSFVYAHEKYPGMRSEHMLSQKAEVAIENEAGGVLAKSWFEWASSANGWTPRTAWSWIGDGTASDFTAPPTPGGSETVRSTHVTSSNSYGRPTSLINASGIQTDIQYGHYANAFIASVTTASKSVQYQRNDRGLVDRITRADGTTQSYTYDAFGRLATELDDAGRTVAEHDVDIQQSATWKQPSSVRKILYGGTSPDAETVQYLDGLGRPIQMQMRGEQGTVVSIKEYDYAGRPYREYRPYRLKGLTSTTSLAFDSSWQRNVSDAYAPDYPIAQTDFEDSPASRPRSVSPALKKDEYDEGNNQAEVYTAFDYGVDPLSTLGLNGMYSFEEVTNADGQTTRSYSDGLGRTVLTVSDPASSDPARTRFHYNDRGNLVKVIKPEGDVVEYRYDAAGQLIERSSPDAGRSRMLRDDAGRLVYSQSANQRVAGTVSYSTYDAEGRPATTGEAAAEWSQLDANAPVPFTSDNQTVRSIRAYDAKPSGTSWPWSLVDWSGLSLENPFGKVVATAHRVTPPEIDHLSGDDASGRIHKVAQSSITAGDVVITDGVRVTLEAGESVVLEPGFAIESGASAIIQTDSGLDEPGADWRIVAFSHDREGQVKTKHVFAPGLARQTFEYEYDLQGRVVSKHVTVGEGAAATHFYQRFEYLPSGNVGAVYASTTDPNPTVPEVRYEYTPDGQLQRTLYRNTRPIDHEYSVRGWLERVGDVDTEAAPFNANYSYTKSGNVKSVQVSHGTNDTFRQHTYTYTYDRFGRISSADFSSPTLLTGVEATSAYDVSGITYDKNGNIQSLQRKGPSGALIDDLFYGYAASSGRPSRLKSVGDVSPADLGWDAQPGNFAYDASGNAVQMPEPYGVSSIVYDTANLPTRVEGGGTDITYRYSSVGQRTYAKVEGEPERHFIREGAALVAEFQNGQLAHWNVLDPGGRVLGRIVP